MSDPIILNHVCQLKISRLIKKGMFLGVGGAKVDITWNCGMGWNPSFNAHVKLINNGNPHLIISYKYKGENISYRIYLDYVKSNLGKGVIWYFICPHTGKRCTKLHKVGKYFCHRTAFSNVAYLVETYSAYDKKRYRDWIRYQNKEKGHQIINSKHFRSHYKGKPTKRYLMAKKWIEEGEGLEEWHFTY